MKGFKEGKFEYHEEVEVDIEALTNLGVGLGRIDSWVVMVPFALPGERVRARIFRNHANYSEADLLEVLKSSPDRVEAKCPLFGQCGGCQYQHLSYEKQLEWKQQQIRDLFERIGGVENPDVRPTWPSPKQYAYRSKLTPHFRKPKDSQPAIGFLSYTQRNRIVDVEQCPIALEKINETLPDLRASVFKNAKKYKRGATLLLRDSLEGVQTDARENCTQYVGDYRFHFTAGEFFQNNPFILPEMVNFALEEARGDDVDTLIDAYCGVGVFGICGHKHFSKVWGVEVSTQAITWAKFNAEVNSVSNATFRVGSAETLFEDLEANPEKTSVIIDPPRKGCDDAFLKQLLEFAPRRIVYVSCGPDTQARDLNTLKEFYTLKTIQPFDLFPQTRHIESVITLIRKN